MKLQLIDSLPCLSVSVAYNGAQVEIPNVLIDTGSVTSVFSTDIVSKIDLTPSPDDRLRAIRGVGGSETVLEKKLIICK